jgi:hypothetical protein
MKSPVQVSSSERWRITPYISQIMKKTIPSIYIMFRNFTAMVIMFLQFIPFSSFYALFPSKS